MEKKSLRFILAVYAGMALIMSLNLVCPLSAKGEKTAAQLVTECNAKIRQAGGLTAVFSMSSSGQTVNGRMKTSGSKFVIDTPTTSTWYDGKSMWTYNSRSRETTVVSPTSAELAETNPLLLINSKISQYSVSYAKNQKAGSKTIVMTPKTKGSGIKSMHVSISTSTFLPTKLVAVQASGGTITINLSSIKTGQGHPDTTFAYPKSKYPKVPVVDLR